MITFMVEDWQTCKAGVMALWEAHYREIATHQDAIPLDPDVPEYERLAENGALCCVVGREAGRVIGYHLSIVRPHLHYRSTLHAFTDIYYLSPEARGQGAGRRMFETVEGAWRERGIIKAFSACKRHFDLARLFTALGWEETETLYTKLFRE